MSSTSTDTALWYLGRGCGVVALVLLTLTVVFGVVTRAGRPLPGMPRFAVTALHRSVSLLAVSFVMVHIATLILDPTSQLRWVDAVLPFRAAWRASWVGLGTVAFDLLVTLIVTSLLRDRIGRRVWRFVHWSAYGLWPMAMLHGLLTGTDAGTLWMTTTSVSCAVAVLAVVVWRRSPSFFDTAGRAPGTRRPGPPVRPANDLIGTGRGRS